jgi:hypothetical protein
MSPTRPRRTLRSALTVLLLTTAVLLTTAGFAAGRTPPTYGDYSQMTTRHAGQIWSGGQPASQWAWNPTGVDSRISWGDPTAWPPPSYEQFTRSGDWVLLAGYGDNTGLAAPQTVTSERIGDINCANSAPIPPDPQGRQHYVKWSTPTTAYCLEAWGYITYQGTRVDFYHRQVWFPPSPTGACANAYITGVTCIKQWEIWRDNNGQPGGPLVEVHRRDNILAAGIGPGFILHNYRTGQHMDLKFHWTW